MTNDTRYANQWHLARINIEAAWAVSTGEGITIAVLDGGVHPHPDLVANLLPGWCVITESSTFSVVDEHGTTCAGLAAAVTNNSLGHAGVAPDAKILPIRVRTTSSTAQTRIIQGLVKAAEMGARVASVSIATAPAGIGGAVSEFERFGGVAVLGMSNNIQESFDVDHPAPILVGGTQPDNTTFFEWGVKIDIVAPATNLDVFTASGEPPTYGYGTNAGNSYAVPQVAGVAALILALRPELGAADVKGILYQSANDTINPAWQPGWDKFKGWGLLDAGAALALAQTWDPVGWRYPEVAIVSPAPGVVPTGESSIVVYAIDDVEVAKVELLVDDVVVGALTSAPYEFSWTPPYAGTYILTARATDNIGQETVSSPVSVTAMGLYSTSGETTSTALPALDPCKSYDVRVRAVNSGGPGPWSAWETQGLTCTVPDVPVADVRFVKDGDIVIAYRQGARATGHEYRVDGGSWLAASNPMTVPLTSSPQAFELRAFNGAGSSSAVSITLPAASTLPVYVSPVADISQGAWEPSSGSDLFAMLDEGSASDVDYIDAPVPTTCELQLDAAIDPASSMGHVLRYRLLPGSGYVKASLKSGSTTIATWGPHRLTETATDYAQRLSIAQADAITDYSDLRVVFEAL